jgi:DNA-binding beta-propeller fold protein YncE
MPFVPALRQSGHPSVTGHYRTERSLVFEGDQTQAQVNIYQTRDLPSNPAPVASIKVGAGCPYGTATDYTGTFYIADNCGGSDVEEYPEGRTAMKTKITTGISNPLGVAIDPSGTLYVSNYPAAITIYPYGTTSPSQTITGGGMTDPFGLALDGSGNLYIADFGASQVFELLKGSSNVIPLNLQNLSEPLGVAVDIKHGYLWVTDGSGNKINVYQLGSTTPFQTIAGTGFPYAISTQERGAHAGYVIYSDLNTHTVYAFKPGQYTPYAQLTTGITQPTGLLLTQP